MNNQTNQAVANETYVRKAVTETSQEPFNQQSGSILNLISRVVTSPDIDISKIEKLLDMQFNLEAKNAEKEFNQAMSIMQSKLPSIPKDSLMKVYSKTTGKNFEVAYASFENIHKYVTPVLTEHGFAVFFQLHTSDNFIKVVCNLTHKSGHKIETEIHLPRDHSGSKNDVQSIGSSISYGKRYAICSLLNIATEKEDENLISNFNQSVINKYVVQIRNANTREELDHLWQLASKETLDLNDLVANNEIKAELVKRKNELLEINSKVQGGENDNH